MTIENEVVATTEEPTSKRVTFSPDPEAQRGRKRMRTPVPLAIVATSKTLSGDSATFRGRSRRRATSITARDALSSAFSSRTPSLNRADRSASPSRKKHFRFAPVAMEQYYRRRRSQSPSRSRSPGMLGATASERRRRRQRTRSRSRDHGITSFPAAGVEVKSLSSSLRVELVVDSEGPRDKGE